MNNLSFYLLIGFGAIFGYIFKDLLRQFGAPKSVSESQISFLVAPFLIIIGTLAVDFFMFFKLNFTQIANIQYFYQSPMFWVAVAVLITGIIRFVVDKLLKKE